jgi:hypothetical protein
MATFPSLRDGSVMRLSSTREQKWGTTLLRFEDDSETRFLTSLTHTHRTLVLTSINGYDLANVREFWRSMKGRFDSTWDIFVDGAWEYNMAFDTDEFSVTETTPGSFAVSLPCLQVRPNT